MLLREMTRVDSSVPVAASKPQSGEACGAFNVWFFNPEWLLLSDRNVSGGS
jgi:hypothetical protein